MYGNLLSAFTWLQAMWNSLPWIWPRWNFKPQWVFHVHSKCSQWNKVPQNHWGNNKCAIALLCSVARISAKIWDGEVYNSKGLELLTTVAELSILDVCWGPNFDSGLLHILRSYEAVTIYCLQTSAIKLFAEKVGRF